MDDSSRKPLPDDDARRRAASNFRTNLIVLAGAGTGKTSLLVERALNAIGSGIAPMTGIAAITFTEKAAGEMRERLARGLDRLRAIARGEVDFDVGEEADRAFRHLTDEASVTPTEISDRALAAMEGLDRGTVATIHGFCSEVLRGFPVEAGVDPGFRVDTGEWRATLSREAWGEFVSRELGPDGNQPGPWEGLMERVSLAEISAVAHALADFTIPAGELDPSRNGVTAAEVFGEAAGRTIEEIDSLLARQTGLAGSPLRFLTSVRKALDAFQSNGPDALRKSIEADPDLCDRLENAGKVPKAGKKLEGVTQAETNRLIKEARLLTRSLWRTDDELMRSLIEVVAPFVRDFRETYLRRGFVSFDGLLALTRDLLRDHPEVRRALKNRYRTLLVDEFQDTDPLQYEIVLFLAEAPEDSAEEAFDARLEPGRLFVVGDAKQSIYRFRGADYSAYDRAVRRILDAGGEELVLTSNFRSTPAVIEPVNALFDERAGYWKESSHQPRYEPIEAVREDVDTSPAVEVWSVDLPEKAKAQDRREAEGRVIAEAVERWVESERRHRYEDITILFRVFTNVSHYLRPLRERNIPFVVDGGREFLKRPEVAQFIATLRALVRPADQPSLLAYLRSPSGGVSDVELRDYAASIAVLPEDERWSWRGEADPERFPNVARSFETLRDIASAARDLPVDATVRLVLERTGLLVLGGAAFEGPQRVANLQKLAASVGELARDGSLSLDEVLEAVEEGRLEDLDSDRPLADDAAPAVRITTIHKIKGLENDVVFIPDLARQERTGSRESEWVRRTSLPGGRPAVAIAAGGTTNSAGAWHVLEDEHHSRAEEVRVLYVALTRARNRLVVLAGPGRGTAPWLESLSAWGYDAKEPPGDDELLFEGRVLHRLLTAPTGRRASDAAPPSDTGQFVGAYEDAIRALHASIRPPVGTPSGLHEDHETERESRIDGGASRDLGRAVGVVVHRALESWNDGDDDTLRERSRRLCADVAESESVDVDGLRVDVDGIVDGLLASPLAERFRDVEHVGHELPILLRSGEGTVYRGSIDLLYRDENDALVVADYKTDRDPDDRALIQRYGRQLGIYAEAVSKALGLDRRPRAELWLLRGGRILAVDDFAGPD